MLGPVFVLILWYGDKSSHLLNLKLHARFGNGAPIDSVLSGNSINYSGGGYYKLHEN